MSSEAISAGIMIIGAVVAAAFLVTAILPAIFTAGGTFGTVAHSADNQIRTDFEIIRAFTPKLTAPPAIPPTEVDVWIKNTGQTRFNRAEIESMDVFFGNSNRIDRLEYAGGTPVVGFSFSFVLSDPASTHWNPGDTLHIEISRNWDLEPQYYFALATPNGVHKTYVFGAGL
jgi:archaellum component FlaG (FlaF/FlaG flagellin family)